jgi:hypothetical protein
MEFAVASSTVLLANIASEDQEDHVVAATLAVGVSTNEKARATITSSAALSLTTEVVF